MNKEIMDHFHIEQVHGFCPWGRDDILRELKKGHGPGRIPGDFVLEGRSGDFTILVSSRICAIPFFFHEKNLTFSSKVIDLLDTIPPVKINHEFFAEELLWEHPLGLEHWCGDIQRLPPNSLVFIRDKVELQVFPLLENLDFSGREMGFGAVQKAFLNIMEDLYQYDPEPVICMSAGYDSRLILSYYLSRGSRPKLITAGTSESTDVKISSQIAKSYELEHEVIKVEASDYLEHGKEISQITMGTKPAHHWHTFIYPRKSRFRNPEKALIVGSNGEFARSFFFDKGLLASAFDQFPHCLLDLYFSKKMSPQRKSIPFAMDDLSKGFQVPDLVKKIQEEFYRDGLSNLDILDSFYAFCRVRHFIGNGLAMYRESFQPISPFLDYRWIEAVAPLGRSLKLNNRVHRYLIGSLVPELVEFPTDDSAVPMKEESPCYWLKKKQSISYDSFPELLENSQLLREFVENDKLDWLLSRENRKKIVDKKHTLSLSVFLPYHFLL